VSVKWMKHFSIHLTDIIQLHRTIVQTLRHLICIDFWHTSNKSNIFPLKTQVSVNSAMVAWHTGLNWHINVEGVEKPWQWEIVVKHKHSQDLFLCHQIV
jgi:hypothetical protein